MNDGRLLDRPFITALIANAPDLDEELRRGITAWRWPNGVCCPRCGHEHVSRLKDYKKFECAACEYQFSVTSGTFMHKTRVPLRKWFLAIMLLGSQPDEEFPRGISFRYMGQIIGVSYPTAWRMGTAIRNRWLVDGATNE